MLSKKLPDQLTLHIGAICGPTFAIIDGNQLDHESVCYNEILQGISESILNVNQVIMTFTPEQLRCHYPLCSEHKCHFFKTMNLKTIPEDHCILRFWFPALTYQPGEWKEAAISVGGLMVTGKYLQQKSCHAAYSWKFASWSHDWYQDPGSWERFEVSAEGDTFFRVKFYRENYQAPVKVYDRSQEVLQDYFMEEEKEKILKRIQIRFSEKQEKGALHTLQQPTLNSKRGYHLDVAFIPNQSTSITDYASQFLVVPFIPVFVGELHYVVPIGAFSGEYFSDVVEKSSEPFLQMYQLFELFSHPDSNIELLSNIGAYRDQWEETAYIDSEPFIEKYPGGWTFLEDESENISQLNFMTVEPEYPKSPICSNSGSGALAAAIVQSLLHPENVQKVYKMRGWARSMQTTWIEQAFEQTTIDIQKGIDGLWEACAPVRMLGKYVCTASDLRFVKDGRG